MLLSVFFLKSFGIKGCIKSFFFKKKNWFCFLFQGEVQPNEINHKSTNPFDYPFDSDVEHNNTVGHDS